MQLEFRSDHDHRAARIVHALTEQVLTEPALLALQHVGKRLQRTLIGARDDTPSAAIVEQCVDSFLKHALFVPDDDIRGAKLDKPLQSVIAVDNAAIEVVQVGGGETAAIQWDERTQLRRRSPE